jgi:hypothetical protein
MDCRDTISKDQGFLKILHEELQSKKKVNLLVDTDGLNRLEGHIVAVREDSIEMDNNVVVPLTQIVAINGVFSADFSEC